MDITILLVLLGVGLLVGLAGGGDAGDEDPGPPPGEDTADEITVVSGQKAFGGGGDDILSADDPVDHSTVFGGTGNDTIDLIATDSELGGGAGNDIITVTGAFDTVYGGDGNDTLTGTEDTVSSHMFGGHGADRFDLDHVAGGPGPASSYFGGNGRDLFSVDLTLDATVAAPGPAPLLAGGNDADSFDLTIALAPVRPDTATAPQVLTRIDDFEPGEDVLVLDAAGATVRLVATANGNDTDVIVTFAGTDSAPPVQGIIRLTGVTDLTLADLRLDPGTLPEPVPEPGPITLGAQQTVNGSAGDDLVTSAPGVTGSTVYGLDGNDTMTVTADYSQLSGGNGNDLLTLDGYHSSIFGGAGNDVLTSLTTSVYNRLFGGDGSDTFNLDYSDYSGAERSASDGGDGADRFNVDLTLTIDPDRPPAVPEVQGGDGNDTFALEVTLGAVFVPDADTPLDRAILTIQDFQAGRDILQIDGHGATVTLAQDARGRFTDVVLTYPATGDDPAVMGLIRLEDVTGLTMASIVLLPATA